MRLRLFALTLLCSSFGGAALVRAQPDPNAEARVFFEEGNRLYQTAARSRGAARHRLLEEALSRYVSSLRIVRSRNVLFNTGLVLEELGRYDEAFTFFTEYLEVEGLSDAEQAEGLRRRDALRQHVAIISVESEPPGATVYVDRLDLAPRGRTPIELALSPGEHRLFFSLPHHADSMHRVAARTGERVAVSARLEPTPVPIRVETPEGGEVRLDGRMISVDEPIEVVPGRHVFTLDLPGRPPIERVIEVAPGEQAVALVLAPAIGERARLLVYTNVSAQVTVSGVLHGEGTRVLAEIDAGEHDLRVEAPGYEPYRRSVRVPAGVTIERDVTLLLAEPTRRFGYWPAWVGVGTAFATAAAVGVAARAFRLRKRYDELVIDSMEDLEEARRLADRGEHLNLAADILWGVAAASSITTLVLALMNRRERTEERISVEASPWRDGAILNARVALGASR